MSRGSSKLSCRGCYRCGSLNHFARNCPQHCSNPEAPGRSKASKSASSLGIEATVAPESLSTQQLEQLLAKRRLEEEQNTLTNRVQVDAITTEVGTPGAVGPTLYLEVQVEGQPVTAVADSGSQATTISRTFLHQIGKHLHRQGRTLPTLEMPTVRLYGKGGKGGGKELIISAQTSLTFATDGRMATVPVFIQPDSEVLCLLGMNVLPALGVKFLRANSESLQTSESLAHNPTTAQVHLVRTSYVPTQKATFLEAVPDQPLQGCGDLVFEPAQETLESFRIRPPEALLSLQPSGHVWIPVQNPSILSTRLSSSMHLGCVTVLPKSEGSLLPSVGLSTAPLMGTDACCLKVATDCPSVSPERLERLMAELQLSPGDLTQNQFQQLQELISDSVDVFALDDSELGCTSLVQH